MERIVNILLIVFLAFLGCRGNDSSEVVLLEDSDPPQKETHHPFLIVTKDMYQALREKASEEPWRSMKVDAIVRSNAGTTNETRRLQEYVGAAALAYILDEENAKIHAKRVRDAIVDRYSSLDIEEKDKLDEGCKTTELIFSAILALDIIYDELSFEDIQLCEKVIESQIFKVSRTGPWAEARYGTHGTWDIYKGIRTEPHDEYYDAIMVQITPDGASPVTNHYAWERVGGGDSRVAKSGYMDVLEFTGIDKRYYNNKLIRKFQRWLFGSSVNCAKEMAIFGDMLPTQEINNDMLHRRVVNFDMEAAGYAAWLHENKPAIGHILTYILPKQSLPQPIVPSSKIFENGGAFFRDKEDDPNGLHAVLYNIKTQDEWHTHNEVNGLSLSGLGNRLLVNGGRLGAPTRAAYLNNTLTLNGVNHDSRLGGGIVDGFTSDFLDFAVGNSGTALPNILHERNLILIHGTDNANGYFLIFDEVEAQPGDIIKNYLHPANQSTVISASSLAEYIAKIDHYATVDGTSVCFYYVTPPTEVNIEKSQSAVQDTYPGYPDHNRLEAVYNTNQEGSLNLATVVYPYNESYPKADFKKIEGEGFSGCSIQQPGVSDFIFESMSGEELVSNEITLNAEFCLVRKSQNEFPFYFVRNGTKMKVGNIGFESINPITIYTKGKTGRIISNGSVVKLYGADMSNIQFDSDATVLNSTANFIEVQLVKGTVSFKSN